MLWRISRSYSVTRRILDLDLKMLLSMLTFLSFLTRG